MDQQAPFKRGDWVIITHRSKPFCVIGEVSGSPSTAYGSGFRVTTLYKFDPMYLDDTNPEQWPDPTVDFVYEKLAEPPAALPKERL